MKYTNFMLYQYRHGVPLKQTCKIRLLNMYWCIQSKCYKKLSIRVLVIRNISKCKFLQKHM